MAVPTARERARELTGAGSAGLTPSLLDFPEPERVELAWAVKDEAVHAWTAEPPRTQRCADVLNAWAREDADPEIVGAAAWCDGLAQLAAGRMEAALDSLDRAHRLLSAVGQHQRAAQSQIPKVIALTMLGRHDAAMASGESTLAELVAAGDDVNAGKVELNLGWMLLRRDRYGPAAQLFRRAAVRFARLGDIPHSIRADVGLAAAMTWQFDFDEALRLYERAAMRVRVRQLTTLQGLIDTNRGRLELHRGRYELALRLLEAALQEAERDGMPQDVAEAQRDLADAYLALNLLPEAIALYDRTIASCEAQQAPVERAWAQVQRALALMRQGELRTAAQGLTDTRALFQAEDLPVGAAWVDLRCAALDLALGQPHYALPRAEGATAVLREAGIDGWASEAELVVADALSELGQRDAALERYAATLAAPTCSPELRVAAHTGRGLLRWGTGELAAARADFESALEQIEQQRAALPGDEFRTAYGADKQRAYDALIEMALDDGDSDAPWRLLCGLERARAPALRAALAQGKQHERGLDSVFRERWRWLHEQWRQAVTEGELPRATQLQARSRELEREWLESQRRVQAAGAGGGPTPGAVDALAAWDTERLCAALPADAALIVFGVIGQRLAACVVTREGLTRVAAPATGLIERIEQLRFQIDSLRFGSPALRHHGVQMVQRARAHLQALHALVWRPVERAVQGRTRVVVAPHRSLHYVPWCALDNGDQPLLSQHEISVVPGVGLWLQGLAKQTSARPLRRAVVAGVGGVALPHVDAEVDAVARAFRLQPGGHASVLRDSDATQAGLRDVLQADADVLHLACHGQFRADSPYFSALHLADGPLTVRDAATLPLPAELVTLSACETGVSRVAPGDEALGLLRGFLLGGAQRVLATQWTVDDASTATLMAQFYAGVLAGQRPAQALRKAQQLLTESCPHPYHWAAFTLHERC